MQLKNSEVLEQLYNQYHYPRTAKFRRYIDEVPPRIARRIETVLRDEARRAGRDLDQLLVLDAGTSLGWTFRHWAETMPRLVGADLDRTALHLTRQRLAVPKPLVICDFTRLPFRAGTLDVIISNTTVEHLPEPRPMFVEFARVLRDDGFLYYSTANRWWPIELHYQLPFLAPLPKRLANLYLRLAGINTTYNDIDLPGYGQFRSMLDGLFSFEDRTFDMLRAPDRYGLVEERGWLVRVAQALFTLGGRPLYALARYFSMGWIFIARKLPRA